MISIKQNYKSSTRIDNSTSVPQFIGNFVVHGTALNTLETLGKEFSNTSQRSFTLTGSYGTGKSTFAFFLSLLLSSNKEDRKLALDKLLETDPNNAFSECFSVDKGWSLVRHVCGLERAAYSLANSVSESLLGVSVADGKTDTDYVRLIKETIEQSPESDGILILVDEMGKALDSQSRRNKDLYFFQELADVVETSNKPAILIGFLHQSFSEYARSMTAKVQREWGKVQGRYRDISYSPSIDESLILIAETLNKSSEINQELTCKYRPLIEAVVSGLGRSVNTTSSLIDALPIDPVVSLLLGPISKRSFSQNERSLFGFLASNEKLSFNQFVNAQYSGGDKNDLSLYGPNEFWEYLTLNLDYIISSSRDGKIWLEAKDAVYRASLSGGSLYLQITKLVSLVTMFGYQHQIFTTRNFLVDYFTIRAHSKEAVVTAIEELEASKVLIYRANHNALTIYQGSDIDVNELVTTNIDAIKDGVDWVSEISAFKYVLASSHYHEKGTMRWVEARLVSDLMVDTLSAIGDLPSDNEAFVCLVIPTSENAKVKLQGILSGSSRIAVGSIESTEVLKSLAIEFIALRKILKENKALVHDKIAKEELNSRLNLIESALDEEVDKIFNQSAWSLNGTSYSSGNLSSVASQLADAIYDQSPVVINELVNRNKPSGSANAAIKKLVMAMAENYEEPLLGFPEDTFPAEKGLYFSCLKNFGLHKLAEGEWKFTSNIDDGNLKRLFKSTHQDVVKGANSVVWLSEIDKYWAAPPYGLSKGIRTIWLMAFVLTHLKDYAFFDRNEATGEVIFIVKPDDEFALKLIQKPQNVAVQAVQVDQEKTSYLNKVADALDLVTKVQPAHASNATPLRLAEGLVTFYAKLSSWTISTKYVLPKARKFIEATKKASDPHEFLFKTLPSILGCHLDEVTSEQVFDLLSGLENAHSEMIESFASTLTQAMGQDLMNVEVCESVVNFTSDFRLKSFAQRLSEIDHNNSKWISNIISLLSSKSERNWDDQAIKKAQAELPEIIEKFKLAAHRAKFKNMDLQSIKAEFSAEVTAINASLNVLDTNKQKALLLALLDEL
ncbi:MAG: hypothetical protein JXR12_11065 [Neptunomonas phycophila]|uniref:hypothetical protein n=1 Tax=Neptunomonas phycophila TaxID=1572645 RepID=UPI003B8DA1F7